MQNTVKTYIGLSFHILVQFQDGINELSTFLTISYMLTKNTFRRDATHQ
jgi:hypothetical protein